MSQRQLLHVPMVVVLVAEIAALVFQFEYYTFEVFHPYKVGCPVYLHSSFTSHAFFQTGFGGKYNFDLVAPEQHNYGSEKVTRF